MGRERKVTIREREKSIQFVFYWRGKQRFESLKLPPTTRNLKAANRLANLIKQDLERDCFDLGEYFPESPNVEGYSSSRPKTLQSLSEKWLRQLEKAENTIRKYKSALNTYWLPMWGERDFRYMTSAEIQQGIADIQWTSTKLRNDCLTPMRGMFEFAKDNAWIRKDPMRKIAFIKPQNDKPDPLTPEEAHRVLGWIETHYPHWHPYFSFRLCAGARPGEVHALLPSDINWVTETVHIKKTQTRKQVKPTKTNEVRDIEINEQAMECLKSALKAAKTDQRTIFAHETGKTITSGKVPRKIWNEALRALEIRHRSSYHTRHTCITMHIMAGANIFWLSGQMGASVTLIESTYATWIRKVARDKETKKFDEYFAKTMPEECQH